MTGSTNNYYDNIAEGYNELHKEEQLKKLNIAKEHIDVKPTDLLLDIGCGTGISTEFWDCKTMGVDPSFKLLKQAKTDVIQTDTEHLPFKDHSFDIVTSFTALHHLKDIDKGLKEIKRVGKDKFIFSILKKANNFEELKQAIKNNFKIKTTIDEGKDLIIVV